MYRNEHMLFELNKGRHEQLLAEAEAERLGIQVGRARAGHGGSSPKMSWQRLAIAAGTIIGVALTLAFNLV